MFQPQTAHRQREPCRGLGTCIPQIPDTRFFHQSHSKQFSNLLVSRAGESWNNTSRGDAQRETDHASVPLFTPKRLLPNAQIGEKKERKWFIFMCLCYRGMQFIKPVFTVELLRCHIDLTYTPTHAENLPSTHKGERIYSSTQNMLQLLSLPANEKINFSFLLSVSFVNSHLPVGGSVIPDYWCHRRKVRKVIGGILLTIPPECW